MSGVILRPYQETAVAKILRAFEEHASTLLVHPTGVGKTTTFCELLNHFNGRVMILAHREELIWQAAQRVEMITGIAPGIEMANMQARGFFGFTRVVISTVQTQISGDPPRMTNFPPDEFDLLICDEAHHAVAKKSWAKVIAHYRQNPRLKVLGVTATPDRADEEALGQVFETVAHDYEIMDAISDGWLVPVLQRCVEVQDLDFSSMRTTAGDLNGADLAAQMEYEKNLHAVAEPTLALAKNRKALLFAASVAHAERLCEIFNRAEDGMARWVCGETPKEERRATVEAFARGDFRILCNCGVFLEGFDDPGIHVIIMARPTKSRALYAQMAGRGFRPLPGLVDGLPTPDARRAAIAASAKPSVELLDFVGNAGRHKLMSSADILGGNCTDEVIERAKANTERKALAGEAVDAAQELAQAERQLRQEAERKLRAVIRANAKFKTLLVDPFDLFGIRPEQSRGWDKGRMLTERQKETLLKAGYSIDGMNYHQQRQLLDNYFERLDNKLATLKQVNVLTKFGGYTAEQARQVKFADVGPIIEAIKANGWKPVVRAPEPAEVPPF